MRGACMMAISTLVAALLFSCAVALLPSPTAAQSMCNMTDFKTSPGITTSNAANALTITWDGDQNQE